MRTVFDVSFDRPNDLEYPLGHKEVECSSAFLQENPILQPLSRVITRLVKRSSVLDFSRFGIQNENLELLCHHGTETGVITLFNFALEERGQKTAGVVGYMETFGIGPAQVLPCGKVPLHECIATTFQIDGEPR